MQKDPPVCLPPQPPSSPRLEVPQGAWDTHAHVIGPVQQYPLVSNRAYTPIECPEDAYLSMLQTLGLQNGVVVQPSIYGTDNRLTVEVVGRHDNLRGVVVLGENASLGEIAEYHKAGIRGFRINIVFPGGPGLDRLVETARLVADFGWHAQLLLNARLLPQLEPVLNSLPVPVVIDHMGHFPFEDGLECEGFRCLLERLAKGSTYVKLSGAYRLSSGKHPVEDTAAIAQRLIAEAPERMFWGSDWPHVGLYEAMPATSALLDGLAVWCPDEATRRMIMVNNPASFYG